ncbi:MAG: methylated-DNA--[protein]-cysteine S-methyltransferase [Burkholderiaceae bacterium]|nr:methylated-DNA--[protein]-cysteine S-methyltransferase [Microbacteriaceae bacterium]
MSTLTADVATAVIAPPDSSPSAILIRRIDSPIGRIEILSDGHAITSLAIEHEGHLPHDGLPDDGCPVLEAAAAQLTEYFAGTRTTFELPVVLVGTAFQRAVWQELVALPWGATSSYGQIGLATGRPTAGRAVGGAVGANPVPIIIGCHRVLAANRRITGYSAGAGVPTKVWLLDHEGIGHA